MTIDLACTPTSSRSCRAARSRTVTASTRSSASRTGVLRRRVVERPRAHRVDHHRHAVLLRERDLAQVNLRGSAS